MIEHHLSISLASKNDSVNAQCVSGNDPWLPKIDKLFRVYQAQVRAYIGSLKVMCCTPGLKKKPKDSELICNSETDHEGESEQGKGNGKGKKAEQGSDMSVHPPEPQAEWKDVTKTYISKLTASCREHAFLTGGKGSRKYLESKYVESNATLNRNSLNYNNKDAKGNTIPGIPALINNVFVERITCVDKDIDPGTQLAFSPLMGATYFPPTSQVVSDHELKLSCGGGRKVYMAGYRGGDSACEQCDDRRGWDRKYLNVTGCDKLKIPGLSFDNAKCNGKTLSRNNWHCVKSKPPIPTPPMPNLSGWSDSCCPPPKTLQRGWNYATGCDHSKRIGADRAEAERCHRGVFGETQACDTQLQVGIYERIGCPPKNSTVAFQLVNVQVNHMLKSEELGCRPWFIMVDAGIRTMIAEVREAASRAKLRRCG